MNVVPEPVADPIAYYEANVAKSLTFVSHLHRTGCDRIIFIRARLRKPSPGDLSDRQWRLIQPLLVALEQRPAATAAAGRVSGNIV
ncbi:hypothetical protein [Streptomyces flaveolus]|uniref:hypothetical protein n=1 Tax=Streptomyces flaveolus TaxID=67297 RepID=UPI0033C96E90